MKTIISKQEYKRRNNEYNKKKYREKLKKSRKMTKEEQMSQRRRKIKDLLVKGLKQKEIYLQLNISKSTCISDIKFLRKQGLL